MDRIQKPCSRRSCLRNHEELYKELNECGLDIPVPVPKLTFHKCGRCNILVCGHHSTASVWFINPKNGKREIVEYNPAICERCSWLADNAGEHGREPGWRATRGEIP